MVGWSVLYCLTSRSKILHLSGDVITISECLFNLGYCWVPINFRQEKIFIFSHLLWHWNVTFWDLHFIGAEIKDANMRSPAFSKIKKTMWKNKLDSSSPRISGRIYSTPFLCDISNKATKWDSLSDKTAKTEAR